MKVRRGASRAAPRARQFVVPADEDGALVSDVEPVPFEQLPPAEARRLETSGLPVLTEQDLAEPLEGAGEDVSPDAGEQAHTREPAPQG